MEIPFRQQRSPRFVATIVALALATGTIAFLGALVPRFLELADATSAISSSTERVGLRIELIKTAAQVFGGVFLLAGVYFTWQSFLLSRDGQITDRFNQAVEHVGSDRMEIRIGGIYALARIARGSARDHWPAMQVLCARLREATKDLTSGSALPVEAQAILDVLGARSRQFEEPPQLLDFSRTNLAGANLSGCHFEGARFPEADLQRVNFSGAHLRGATFAGANLREASFRDADCTEANLIAANLQYGTLRNCVLRKGVMLGAKLEGASLVGADLTGALFATRDQFSEAVTDHTTVLPDFSEVPPDFPQMIPF